MHGVRRVSLSGIVCTLSTQLEGYPLGFSAPSCLLRPSNTNLGERLGSWTWYDLASPSTGGCYIAAITALQSPVLWGSCSGVTNVPSPSPFFRVLTS